MAREGGAEKSLRRESACSYRTEGVIPVPQAFVLRVRVSCVCGPSCLLSSSEP